MSVHRAGASKVAEVVYTDVASALGAFMLLYHCVVLDDRALLVDFQLPADDESVTVPDEYLAPVLVRALLPLADANCLQVAWQVACAAASLASAEPCSRVATATRTCTLSGSQP